MAALPMTTPLTRRNGPVRHKTREAGVARKASRAVPRLDGIASGRKMLTGGQERLASGRGTIASGPKAVSGSKTIGSSGQETIAGGQEKIASGRHAIGSGRETVDHREHAKGQTELTYRP